MHTHARASQFAGLFFDCILLVWTLHGHSAWIWTVFASLLQSPPFMVLGLTPEVKYSSLVDPGFPRRRGNPKGDATLFLANFPPKMHENEDTLVVRGRASLRLPWIRRCSWWGRMPFSRLKKCFRSSNKHTESKFPVGPLKESKILLLKRQF